MELVDLCSHLVPRMHWSGIFAAFFALLAVIFAGLYCYTMWEFSRIKSENGSLLDRLKKIRRAEPAVLKVVK